MQEDQDREDSCRSDDTDSPVGPPSPSKKGSAKKGNVETAPSGPSSSITMPNYVNVPKDVGTIECLSDDLDGLVSLDDLQSGMVIGANLSDEDGGEVNDDDDDDVGAGENLIEASYKKSSRDHLNSR